MKKTITFSSLDECIKELLAPNSGLEPETYRLEICCSIRLSYGLTWIYYNIYVIMALVWTSSTKNQIYWVSPTKK